MDDPLGTALRGLTRGLHLAGYFTAFGTCLFAALLAQTPGLRRLAWAGGALALLAGAVWFWVQTADFADAYDPASVLAAIPLVVQDTWFGPLLLGRLGLLLLALLCAQAGKWRPAAALSGLGVLAQAWLGHGAAMGGRVGHILLLSALFHLAAAAAWLGTLPALSLALNSSPDPKPLAEHYSRLGQACVLTLLLTALIQYLLLIAHPQALFTTAYGLSALIKLILLTALITLAARNKLRLTPTLPSSRQSLRRTITAELALGLLTLLAAGILMQLEPPAMMGMGGAG